jgi:hypothetical protein
MHDGMTVSSMKSTIKFQTKGYYECVSIREHEYAPSPSAFILFEDGYFLNSGVPSDWKLARGRWQWGKYRVDADSLTIQYFEYAISGFGFIGIFVANHTLAAQEFHGYILNDSTVYIQSVKYHHVVDLKILPIREVNFDPPLEYRFVHHSFLPEPNNWLMDEERKKK